MAKTTRRYRKKKNKYKKYFAAILIVLAVICGVWTWICAKPVDPAKVTVPDWIEQEFLDIDGHSRTGWEIEGVRNPVVHYVANPGSTAAQNRNYFNSDQSWESSHFIVGLEGEILQCIPLNEQSSATGIRNSDTISIEVCHPDATGEFSIPTYNSLVKLLAWLCEEFNLDEEDIIRHYDVTGKNCPKYYVENPEAWEELKNYVKERI